MSDAEIGSSGPPDPSPLPAIIARSMGRCSITKSAIWPSVAVDGATKTTLSLIGCDWGNESRWGDASALMMRDGDRATPDGPSRGGRLGAETGRATTLSPGRCVWDRVGSSCAGRRVSVAHRPGDAPY